MKKNTKKKWPSPPHILKARRLFFEAKAEFFTSINDINNEYGTNYTVADLTKDHNEVE